MLDVAKEAILFLGLSAIIVATLMSLATYGDPFAAVNQDRTSVEVAR